MEMDQKTPKKSFWTARKSQFCLLLFFVLMICGIVVLNCVILKLTIEMVINVGKIAEEVAKILNRTEPQEDIKEENKVWGEKIMDIYKKRRRLIKFLERT